MDSLELEEFQDGFAKFVYRAEIDSGPEAFDALLNFVRNWVVSVTLREEDEWQAEMERTAAAPVDADTPTGVAGMRALLAHS